MNEKTNISRNFNLDILRITAFVFVPLTHFFLYTDFYTSPVNSVEMCVSLCLRNLGLLCITIFMLLTGYLQGNKNIPPTLKYYSKILKFIVPHVLVILFDLFLKHFYKGTELSAGIIARNLFSFPGYSWYVEMYIGLFLLIPFLNMIWSSLKTKKQEHILLSVLIILSVLPSIVNVYDFVNPNWWNATASDYLNLLPTYWNKLYSIAFYFTGAYLSKHKDEILERIKPFTAFLLFVGSFALFSLYCITRNWEATPSIYPWLNRNSFGQMVVAVFLILFIVSIRFSKVPSPIRKIAGRISDITYTAYLVSFTVDTLMYGKFNSIFPTFSERLPYLPLAVLTVVFCSLILAFFLDLISRLIIKLADKVIFALSAKITKKQ